MAEDKGKKNCFQQCKLQHEFLPTPHVQIIKKVENWKKLNTQTKRNSHSISIRTRIDLGGIDLYNARCCNRMNNDNNKIHVKLEHWGFCESKDFLGFEGERERESWIRIDFWTILQIHYRNPMIDGMKFSFFLTCSNRTKLNHPCLYLFGCGIWSVARLQSHNFFDCYANTAPENILSLLHKSNTFFFLIFEKSFFFCFVRLFLTFCLFCTISFDFYSSDLSV